MKKECTRIFSDKKLFFTAVLMPGIMIGVMYFLMGNLMGDMFAVEEDYIFQVHAVNMPQSISAKLPPSAFNIHNTPEADVEKIKQRIENRETDLLIRFPQNFDELVAAYDVNSTEPAPNIQMWSNSARSESMNARGFVSWILTEYQHTLSKFTVNAPADDPDESYELATDADMFGMVIGFMIPLMFMLFLYTGCMSLAPESIAGEKERGTLGGMLVTPARRSDMALAKILSISIFGLMSAVVSMAAMIISLPSMLPLQTGSILDMFSVQDLALLLLVAVATTLVFVSVLSLLSAYAKSVKEATAYASSIMILIILCGLGSMILGGVPEEIYYYLIPVFNSALSLTAVIDTTVSVSAVNIIATAGANLLFTLGCVVLLAKLFSSEKIVFDK
jgi:sodium transport system permease protein